MALITAPTLDMARPGDMIGLGKGLTPAHRAEHVWKYLPIIATAALSPDRHRITVQGNAGEMIMTMGPHVPVVLDRP